METEHGSHLSLRSVVEALEELTTEKYPHGLLVDLQLGDHSYCDIESNCPLAIQLRKYIAEAEVPLADILERIVAASTAQPQPLTSFLAPEVSAQVQVEVGGKHFELDIKDMISGQLAHQIRDKLRQLDEANALIANAGRSFYRNYQEEIHRQSQTRALPQLHFPLADMIRFNPLITSNGNRSYIFLFPLHYHPEYLVKRGVRYELSTRDKAEVDIQCFLEIEVNNRWRISSCRLLNNLGYKFIHYHGNDDYDCWGNVHWGEIWDRRLSSLHQLVHTLGASLITINMDSLLTGNPSELPSAESLMHRSEELGREGDIREVRANAVAPMPPPEGRWGRGWGNVQAIEREREEARRGRPALPGIDPRAVTVDIDVLARERAEEREAVRERNRRLEDTARRRR